MKKIMSVFGTRPEAIKMCPLIKEIQADPDLESIVCVTAQHRSMLDQVLEIFDIKPNYDLDIMLPKQTLSQITTRIIQKIEPILLEAKPDMVLVHGDTTTSFAVALAAFYQQIPVGHVEAGLRTYNKYSPFPEELNRVMTSNIATVHFAPTNRAKENLLKENITENIFVTGNTVIDSFKYTLKENIPVPAGKYILMTAHRRENLGRPLRNICNAVNEIVSKYPDIKVIYPVHLNPAVSEPVKEILGGNANVTLTEPLDVCALHNLMKGCFMVLTDSGGLQEEGPSFKKPVLVLRTETERPEAVEANCVKVIGVNKDNIVKEVSKVIDSEEYYQSFLKNPNPYGDGNASKRIVDAIKLVLS
ncbi:MAG: UDP-N-acetylglucosamine 2-epimerase (non-hydrolyzing) [Oscillospiraceae bacterium]